MRMRTLEPGEEPRLLRLLDGWPFRDGRRGRDFFRRYLEHDPAYEPRNVLVAERAGELVSCVQIFPRTVRSARGELSCGGIGSVFTVPAQRRSGVASELLQLAVAAMDARRMALSLLLASRVRWYSKLGWRELVDREVLLELAAPLGLPRARSLRAREELERVAEVGADYGRRRWGVVVRDSAAWAASLRLAGDPDERFRVAGPGGEIDAYLRVAELDGEWRALEWGCVEGRAGLLAELLLSESRGRLVAPPLHDRVLENELRGRGARISTCPAGASWMARPVALAAEELSSALPREHFAFWPADRF